MKFAYIAEAPASAEGLRAEGTAIAIAKR